MATKHELISDIILRVTKGAPSDDLELEPSQVAFWFDLAAKEILPKYLNKQIKDGLWLTIDPILIEVEDNKTAVVEDVTMLSDWKDRIYITTTKTPLGLRGDAGLIRVITDQGSIVNKVSLEKLDTINKLTFAKPSRENLLHTRVGTKIYIHGIIPQHVGLTQFSISYIPVVNISALDDSDEVKLPDEIIGLVSDAVEEKAIAELRGVADVENDAEDDIQ